MHPAGLRIQLIMTIATETPRTPTLSSRRSNGYLAAILVNAVLLYVANNLLGWGFPRFLTSDFGRVLWIINLSLVATIIVNFAYLGFDGNWFKSATQIGLNALTLTVSVRMYQVFPFDFSSYQFDYTAIARIVIILTIVGTLAAMIVELVKLATAAAQR